MLNTTFNLKAELNCELSQNEYESPITVSPTQPVVPTEQREGYMVRTVRLTPPPRKRRPNTPSAVKQIIVSSLTFNAFIRVPLSIT